MLKYVAAAQALRLFSLNGWTKAAYRKLGNYAGSRSRASGIPPHYIMRADANLRAIEKIGAVFDGARLLELGTGWVHWEALYTRLFYEVHSELFDVWDNRQLAGLMRYANELGEKIDELPQRSIKARQRATQLLDDLQHCNNMQEIYRILQFNYRVEPQGSLHSYDNDTFDLVISSDVLEHVPRHSTPALTSELYRVLKPGGVAAQQIVLTDHLGIYDKKVHPKNYLRYNDTTWKLLFNNDVQYINRLQRPEWISLFQKAGFELDNVEVVSRTEVSGLQVSDRFRSFTNDDLEVTVLRILARKPF